MEKNQQEDRLTKQIRADLWELKILNAGIVTQIRVERTKLKARRRRTARLKEKYKDALGRYGSFTHENGETYWLPYSHGSYAWHKCSWRARAINVTRAFVLGKPYKSVENKTNSMDELKSGIDDIVKYASMVLRNEELWTHVLARHGTTDKRAAVKMWLEAAE